MSTTPTTKPTLPGVNVMLMGPAGTGKTHSIGTLVETGIEVYYLALESGLESLLGYWTDRGKPIPANLHWHQLKAPDTSFLDMLSNAERINTMSLDSLAKMSDPNRSRHNQFVELFRALNDFPDDRTGQKFGSVNTWGPDRALVIDGMTGLGKAALSLVVGGKPVRSQSDWGIAQQQLEGLLGKLCDGCQCHFILLSHVERETDMVMGGVKLMASTLGKALAPKIPAMFSDVILTTREGTKWSWDTANAMADLKSRNLPIAGGQTPSFAPIIEKWRKRAAAGA
jgi:AAA domain